MKELQQTASLIKDKKLIHPYSIFNCYRSVCTTCTTCFEYNGNYNIGTQIRYQANGELIQFLECLTCSCPMNAHISLNNKNKFSSQIFTHLAEATVQIDNISFNCYPICFVKNAKSNIHELTTNFYNYLPQIGFNIMSKRTFSKRQYEIIQIKKEILTGIEKQLVQKLMTFIQFLELQKDWYWDENMPEQINQSQYEIIKKLRSKVKIDNNVRKGDQIIAFFVKNINKFDHFQLINILSHYENILGGKFLWTPGDSKQKFLASTLMFPQYFTLNHQIFMIPSQKTDIQAQKYNSRFKDLLDYNDYTAIGQIKEIARDKLQLILKFQNYNKVNYLLSEQQLNPIIKRTRINLAAKVGPSVFTIPFKNAVDFIQISSETKKSPFMLAFPDYLRSQRCVIILRPAFCHANLSQILMTLLRVNKFNLLKRRYHLFTEQEAKYLATLQKIQPHNLDAYIKMMTAGMSEIVLVSKRGALYEANILCNGSKDGISDMKTKMLKNLPLVNLRRGNQTYEYTPTINPFNSSQNDNFRSLKQIFKLQQILFPQIQIQQSKYVTNIKTGQLVKIQPEIKQRKQLKISSKMRDSILSEIRRDNFNYWVMTSKSELLTEQLAGLFIPETTLFESCVVIVKPRLTHLISVIQQALRQHRYHIIMQKTIKLERSLSKELISKLQKINTGQNELSSIIQGYTGETIHIMCISKIYAKQQINSLLSQFSFLTTNPRYVNDKAMDYIDDQDLVQVLIPVWNNEEVALKILSSPLYNVEEAIHSLEKPGVSLQNKFQILKYLVGSYYGVNITDINLNSPLGKFSYYISTPVIANLQSWFYSQLIKQNARYVPNLFQHRIIGQTCFIIQSHSGYPFLNLIANQYHEQITKFKQVYENQQRKSLTLFLWGRKFSQFSHRITCKGATLRGWGKIVKKHQQWQGQHLPSEVENQEREFLRQCLQRFDDSEWEIQENIKKLINSRYIKQKFNDNTKRKLIPYFIQHQVEECIRIVETQQTAKLHLVDKYSMADPDHEKTNKMNLYTLNIYNVEPMIGTKEQFIVQIIMFFMKWQKQNEELSIILEGLLKHYISGLVEYEGADSNIDEIQSELYIRMLKQYFRNKQSAQTWLKLALREYPKLKKGIIHSNKDEISGKKRKFLDKKQYYQDGHNKYAQEQRVMKNKKYQEFNLNYEFEKELKQKQQKRITNKQQNNPLLNLEDPIHRRLAYQDRTISLLREDSNNTIPKNGMYVQYEKKLTENEQMMMNKIKQQVNKFTIGNQEKIIYETGLEKDLWYRKTKGEKIVPRQTQVDDAIKKQIGKLMEFKREENEKRDKQIYDKK